MVIEFGVHMTPEPHTLISGTHVGISSHGNLHNMLKKSLKIMNLILAKEQEPTVENGPLLR